MLCTMALMGGCKDNDHPTKSNPNDTIPKDTVPIDTVPVARFAKGADISWITEQERAGIKFYSQAGVQKDILDVLKDQGMNSIRLRVWVNPTDGWCNKADMLAKARRVKAAGMRMMLDFHYSDSWADPGKQPQPRAWVGKSVAAMKDSVYAHTVNVLQALLAEGIVPEWVQVGNETDNGMLWETGKASTNMANYAAFVQKGYEAVKATSPTSKVIVHVSNGYKNDLFRWNLDGLKANGAHWDVIGMSLYPSFSGITWQNANAQILANMTDMIARHGSEVMVVEVGMPFDQAQVCHDFLKDLIAKVKGIPGNKGLGVLYWEPQSYNRYKGYTLGAFTNNGRPTVALDAFKE